MSPSVTKPPTLAASSRALPGPRLTPRSRARFSIQLVSSPAFGARNACSWPPAAFTASSRALWGPSLRPDSVSSAKTSALPGAIRPSSAINAVRSSPLRTSGATPDTIATVPLPNIAPVVRRPWSLSRIRAGGSSSPFTRQRSGAPNAKRSGRARNASTAASMANESSPHRKAMGTWLIGLPGALRRGVLRLGALPPGLAPGQRGGPHRSMPAAAPHQDGRQPSRTPGPRARLHAPGPGRGSRRASRPDSAGPTTRSARPSTQDAVRPACRHRPRSAPRDGPRPARPDGARDPQGG